MPLNNGTVGTAACAADGAPCDADVAPVDEGADETVDEDGALPLVVPADEVAALL